MPRVIAQQCGGDVRKAVSACELLYEAADVTNGELLLKSEDALQVAQRSAMRYDKGGDAMYDCASALMKSLRGSDPDAALHYLARFLEAGDLVTPCRRLLCPPVPQRHGLRPRQRDRSSRNAPARAPGIAFYRKC